MRIIVFLLVVSEVNAFFTKTNFPQILSDCGQKRVSRKFANSCIGGHRRTITPKLLFVHNSERKPKQLGLHCKTPLPSLQPLARIGNSESNDESFEESFARDAAWQASLFGTDLDSNMLETAKRAERSMKKSSLTELSLWERYGLEMKQLPEDWLEVDYFSMLGGGTYGEVYEARLVGGPSAGLRVVCKRAKDGLPPERGRADSETLVMLAQVAPEELEIRELALRYLEVEAFMNDLVRRVCPGVAAAYHGTCRVAGRRWLVWQHAGNSTLEALLQVSHQQGSLEPLARALGDPAFVEGDAASLQRLVNTVALELLLCCQSLERAGISHRDLKPYNILIRDRRLVLIDFGSAAAMGLPGRPGYDNSKAPCDPRYGPPEEFIDEDFWDRYDVYCVGLILVRILFAPLWSGERFDEFSESYHRAGYDLDLWLERINQQSKEEGGGGGGGRTGRLRFPLLSRFRDRRAALARDPATRNQEYVDLAVTSCQLDLSGHNLNFCSMKLGLEVLCWKEGGIWWDTLRRMLARDAANRIRTDEVLDRLNNFRPWREPPAERDEE